MNSITNSNNKKRKRQKKKEDKVRQGPSIVHT